MTTTYFTIVSGAAYEQHVSRLQASATRLGIVVHVVRVPQDASIATIKKQKPLRMLELAHSSERLVYVDADTLLVDVSGIETLSGSLKEPWGMGKVPLTALMDTTSETEKRQQQLFDILDRRNLGVFLPGGELHRQEWNSGVIVGPSDSLKALATRWLEWWHILDTIFDGRFRRDQIAYRYAYYEWSRDYPDVFHEPFNWICKRRGLCGNPKIYHLAGLQKQPAIQHKYYSKICHQLRWTL